MIYPEEKEPPSRPIYPEGVVGLAVTTLFERRAAGLSWIFEARPVSPGVRSK
jgi:hypothetical protein